MSDPQPQKVQEIFNAAKAACESLEALHAALEQRLQEIRILAFKQSRDLTDAEKLERAAIRSAQEELGEALVVLGFETLQQVDETPEMARLKVQIDRVNSGLADDLHHLKKIEKYADLAADVSGALVKVAGKVAGVLV